MSKLTSKTSPFVTHHIESLLHPFPEASPGINHFTVTPTTLSSRETQLFWKYHGHFPQEFTQAIINTLPPNYHFIQYDHLSNRVTVDVS